MWNMDRGTGMRLRKVCPQCSTVIPAKRSVCECSHAFTLKIKACITDSSPVKKKKDMHDKHERL